MAPSAVLRKTPHSKPELTDFGRIHGPGSLSQLQTLLSDHRMTYEAIGMRFGVSKQRIGQLAQKLAINGRERERQRLLRRLTISRHIGYSAGVRAVIRAIKRLGFEVLPYRQRGRSGRMSKQTVLVNGVACRIYCRRHSKGTVCGGRYVQFRVGCRTKAVTVTVFALWNGRTMKLYVVPSRDLVNVSSFMLPFAGRYSTNGKKPKRDWTRYEDAWQFIKR